MEVERRLTAVVAVDVAGYSRLMERDEEGTLRALDDCRKAMDDIVPRFGGHIFAETGDGCMIRFSSVVQALRAALRIREHTDGMNFTRPLAAWMRLRIGIDLADAVIEGDNLRGEGVNVAARLGTLADPGEICISGTVYNQVRNKLDLGYEFAGHHKLKNIAEPVAVFRVHQDSRTHVPLIRRFRARLRTGRGALVLAGVLAVTLLGVVFAGYVPETRAPADPASIAVMPFVDLSPAADQTYLSDGIAEELLNALARVKGLKVASRTSSFAFKHREPTVQEIGAALGVAMILEGSVRRENGQVRLNVQLIKATDGFHVWSQSYSRDLQDILALQSEVAHAVARAVAREVKLVPHAETRLVRARQVDPKSYESYLRGVFYLNQVDPKDTKKGLDYLQSAIRDDPKDPVAYARLALAYNELGRGAGAPPEAYPRCQALAKEALALDDTVAEAHLALAQSKLYYEWDWVGAERAFKRALELNPNLAAAHAHYAWYLVLFGRWDEAVAEVAQARELDPLSPRWAAWLAWIYWGNGQFKLALQEVGKSLELDPQYPLGLHVLGSIYTELGRFDEAITAHRKAAALDPVWLWGLGRVYAKAGHAVEARKIAGRLIATDPVDTWGLAVIYAVLGDKDSAFRWLEASHGKRRDWLPWIRRSPSLSSLRDDSRFRNLMVRLNLPS